MPSTAIQPATPVVIRPEGKWRTWLPLIPFLLLWAVLIRQLSYVWSTNDQYAYGWFVPILGLGIIVKKWPTRPLAAPSTGAGGSNLSFQLSAFQRFPSPS